MTQDQLNVFAAIAEKALSLTLDRPYIIGINGKDAAGKTVFSDAFASYMKSRTDREIIRISIDDFMNPSCIRDTPSGSLAESAYLYTFDEPAFKNHALGPLQPGGNLVYKTKVFDEATDQPNISDDRQASRDAIVIIDGVLLFKPDLVDYLSLKVLLEISDETAMDRGIQRDTTRYPNRTLSEHRTYRSTYIACQTMYYQRCQPVQIADIVIDNNDYNAPKILRPR